MPSPNQSVPSPSAIDALRVRALFADPARIAASAFLRREIAARMMERLDLIRLAPRSVLDAGCGTGEDVLALRRRYPEASLIGADQSEAMLASAQATLDAATPLWKRWVDRLTGSRHQADWLHADFAALPLAEASVDMLWSNLVLHWHPSPPAVFAEWRRVLRTDGVLMFSCFGPDTFREVRRAFARADDAPHVADFIDMHDLGDLLQRTGFATPVMDMETITVTYDSAQELIADVRAFGGNALLDRRRGLMSRAQGARVMQALDAQRNADGRIPLTFEVLYGHAFKGAAAKREQREATVHFLPRLRD